MFPFRAETLFLPWTFLWKLRSNSENTKNVSQVIKNRMRKKITIKIKNHNKSLSTFNANLEKECLWMNVHVLKQYQLLFIEDQ